MQGPQRKLLLKRCDPWSFQVEKNKVSNGTRHPILDPNTKAPGTEAAEGRGRPCRGEVGSS